MPAFAVLTISTKEGRAPIDMDPIKHKGSALLFIVLVLLACTHCGTDHVGVTDVFCGTSNLNCTSALPRCADPGKVFCHPSGFCSYTVKKDAACPCIVGAIEECPDPAHTVKRCSSTSNGSGWGGCGPI